MSSQAGGAQDAQELSTLLALRISDEAELFEGTTFPIKMACAPITDLATSKDYAVKFRSNIGFEINGATFGIASEIVSGFLAKYFEIPIPDFCLVEVTQALREAVYSNPQTSAKILQAINQNTHGFNFGSLFFVQNFTSPLPLKNLSAEQRSAAETIFAFDALIYNADRTETSPNLLLVEDQFLVFDHEKAFNFLVSQDKDYSKSLDFRNPDGISFLSSHFFYKSLRGYDPQFVHFFDKLKALRDKDISHILEQVPHAIRQEFRSQFEHIEEYIKNARNNHAQFRLNLTGVVI
ncbi:MAG: hypothetical protein KJZ53_02225 [Anaerolineales bacterium]|nr:hypothetical protein [Anaerolineales bacterium]